MGSKMKNSFNYLQPIFWIVLVAFLSWDWLISKPIDLRFEPPLIAAGSGVETAGGHCSAAPSK
jgi:hypothetical protein